MVNKLPNLLDKEDFDLPLIGWAINDDVNQTLEDLLEVLIKELSLEVTVLRIDIQHRLEAKHHASLQKEEVTCLLTVNCVFLLERNLKCSHIFLAPEVPLMRGILFVSDGIGEQDACKLRVHSDTLPTLLLMV